jgi:hypothetical protein
MSLILGTGRDRRAGLVAHIIVAPMLLQSPLVYVRNGLTPNYTLVYLNSVNCRESGKERNAGFGAILGFERAGHAMPKMQSDVGQGPEGFAPDCAGALPAL